MSSSKRVRTESPSKHKSKRTRVSNDQPTIHHFFSSPKKSENNISTPTGTSSSQRSSIQPLVIDVDALYDEDEEPPPPMPFEGPSVPEPGVLEVNQVVTKLPTSKDPVAYEDLTHDPITRFVLKPWSSISVPYSFLAHALSTLTQTRSRKTITNVITNCLLSIIQHDPQSLLAAIYLLSNTLAPPYSSVELGLGPSIISRSIQHVSGLSASALKRLYNSLGDPGDVAFAAKSNVQTLVPHPPLLVNFVYASLVKIAGFKGQGIAKEKEKVVQKLLLAATGEEIRFLTRTLFQNLRVGAVRTTILTALSHAMVLTPIAHFTKLKPQSSLHVSEELLVQCTTDSRRNGDPSHGREEIAAKFKAAESLVKQVYVQHPNYDDIVTALLHTGLDGLPAQVVLTVGIPLHPTLGSPTRSLDEIYEICKDRPFIAEFKYDGQRVQIHGSMDGEKISVHLFSRRLENMTSKYPDIVQLVTIFFRDHPETTSFILDAEIVPIDLDGGLKSFQDLSNRARKDVQLQDVQVFVSVFVFDLMYLNGEVSMTDHGLRADQKLLSIEVLLERTFRERRDLLFSRFPPYASSDPQVARLSHVENCGSEEGKDAIEAFWEKALESRCEGLMVKLLDNEATSGDAPNRETKSRRKQLPATYEPDKRTSAWLKLKKDYVTGLGDTLDLIPIGAWHGNGRKAQWWSPILLGLWQPDSGQIVADLTARYPLSEDSDTCSQRPLWNCETGGSLIPEVYFKPSEVWEIRGAEYVPQCNSSHVQTLKYLESLLSITLSPVSVAAKGLITSSRGLSLRFPRFIKVREDKSLEEASSPAFLARLWREQEKRGKMEDRDNKDDGDLVDIEFDAVSQSSSPSDIE
ncbi:hypothetical protein H0H92_000607 [Tricholoma furcatifolium]|nr:hypothetical protein H0H92_000607 [Tricholoma furcatifolium]